MGDFSQNGIVSTLHDFKTKSTDEIERELLEFSKERKMELILPCLYSELEGEALPKIVSEISKTKYLNHIIIGLDKGIEIMGMALREAREHFEREYLMAQVDRFGGNISQTAVFIGMERSALHRKLKSQGVN